MASLTRLLALTLLIAGCDEKDDESVACETMPWTYENTGQIFLMNWCTSCHHSEIPADQRYEGSENVNLDTYDSFIANLDIVEIVALSESPTMPEAGGPTTTELEQMREWVACGAPQ